VRPAEPAGISFRAGSARRLPGGDRLTPRCPRLDVTEEPPVVTMRPGPGPPPPLPLPPAAGAVQPSRSRSRCLCLCLLVWLHCAGAAAPPEAGESRCFPVEMHVTWILRVHLDVCNATCSLGIHNEVNVFLICIKSDSSNAQVKQ